MMFRRRSTDLTPDDYASALQRSTLRNECYRYDHALARRCDVDAKYIELIRNQMTWFSEGKLNAETLTSIVPNALRAWIEDRDAIGG